MISSPLRVHPIVYAVEAYLGVRIVVGLGRFLSLDLLLLLAALLGFLTERANTRIAALLSSTGPPCTQLRAATTHSSGSKPPLSPTDYVLEDGHTTRAEVGDTRGTGTTAVTEVGVAKKEQSVLSPRKVRSRPGDIVITSALRPSQMTLGPTSLPESSTTTPSGRAPLETSGNSRPKQKQRGPAIVKAQGTGSAAAEVGVAPKGRPRLPPSTSTPPPVSPNRSHTAGPPFHHPRLPVTGQFRNKEPISEDVLSVYHPIPQYRHLSSLPQGIRPYAMPMPHRVRAERSHGGEGSQGFAFGDDQQPSQGGAPSTASPNAVAAPRVTSIVDQSSSFCTPSLTHACEHDEAADRIFSPTGSPSSQLTSIQSRPTHPDDINMEDHFYGNAQGEPSVDEECMTLEACDRSLCQEEDRDVDMADDTMPVQTSAGELVDSPTSSTGPQATMPFVLAITNQGSLLGSESVGSDSNLTFDEVSSPGYNVDYLFEEMDASVCGLDFPLRGLEPLDEHTKVDGSMVSESGPLPVAHRLLKLELAAEIAPQQAVIAATGTVTNTGIWNSFSPNSEQNAGARSVLGDTALLPIDLLPAHDTVMGESSCSPVISLFKPNATPNFIPGYPTLDVWEVETAITEGVQSLDERAFTSTTWVSDHPDVSDAWTTEVLSTRAAAAFATDRPLGTGNDDSETTSMATKIEISTRSDVLDSSPRSAKSKVRKPSTSFLRPALGEIVVNKVHSLNFDRLHPAELLSSPNQMVSLNDKVSSPTTRNARKRVAAATFVVPLVEQSPTTAPKKKKVRFASKAMTKEIESTGEDQALQASSDSGTLPMSTALTDITPSKIFSPVAFERSLPNPNPAGPQAGLDTVSSRIIAGSKRVARSSFRPPIVSAYDFSSMPQVDEHVPEQPYHDTYSTFPVSAMEAIVEALPPIGGEVAETKSQSEAERPPSSMTVGGEKNDDCYSATLTTGRLIAGSKRAAASRFRPEVAFDFSALPHDDAPIVRGGGPTSYVAADYENPEVDAELEKAFAEVDLEMQQEDELAQREAEEAAKLASQAQIESESLQQVVIEPPTRRIAGSRRAAACRFRPQRPIFDIAAVRRAVRPYQDPPRKEWWDDFEEDPALNAELEAAFAELDQEEEEERERMGDVDGVA